MTGSTKNRLAAITLLLLSLAGSLDSAKAEGAPVRQLEFGNSEWCLPEGEPKFPDRFKGLLQRTFEDLPEWMRNPSAFQCIGYLEVDPSHPVGSYVRGSAILFTTRWPQIWDSMPDRRVLEEMRKTLAHELAHLLFRDLDRDRRTQFIELSWQSNLSRTPSSQTGYPYSWVPKAGACFVGRTAASPTAYARTNPGEDWSTTVQVFVTDRRRLQLTCPRKFEFMRQLERE